MQQDSIFSPASYGDKNQLKSAISNKDTWSAASPCWPDVNLPECLTLYGIANGLDANPNPVTLNWYDMLYPIAGALESAFYSQTGVWELSRMLHHEAKTVTILDRSRTFLSIGF
jgi:hypothetical protein